MTTLSCKMHLLSLRPGGEKLRWKRVPVSAPIVIIKSLWKWNEVGIIYLKSLLIYRNLWSISFSPFFLLRRLSYALPLFALGSSCPSSIFLDVYRKHEQNIHFKYILSVFCYLTSGLRLISTFLLPPSDPLPPSPLIPFPPRYPSNPHAPPYSPSPPPPPPPSIYLFFFLILPIVMIVFIWRISISNPAFYSFSWFLSIHSLKKTRRIRIDQCRSLMVST